MADLSDNSYIKAIAIYKQIGQLAHQVDNREIIAAAQNAIRAYKRRLYENAQDRLLELARSHDAAEIQNHLRMGLMIGPRQCEQAPAELQEAITGWNDSLQYRPNEYGT